MKAFTSGRVIWPDILPFDCRHEVVSFAIRRSSQAQLGCRHVDRAFALA